MSSTHAPVKPVKIPQDERFSRPVPPLVERFPPRKTQSFVLTGNGIRKFIKDRTKTPEETLEFLHDLGCTWDKDGRITVHPI